MINLKKINHFLYLSITALIVINLINTNALATQGIVVNTYYSKIQSLKRDNQRLEFKINQLNNLSSLYKLAVDKGYQPINQVTIVPTIPSIVAEKPVINYQ